jgi:hypothetical protein
LQEPLLAWLQQDLQEVWLLLLQLVLWGWHQELVLPSEALSKIHFKSRKKIMHKLNQTEIELVTGNGALGAVAGAWVGGVIGAAAVMVAAGATGGLATMVGGAAVTAAAGLGATLGSAIQDLL